MKMDGLEAGGSSRLSFGAAGPVWATLSLVGGLAWVVTVGQARDMGVGPGTMDVAFPLFLGMWAAMMAAMMLPAIGPQAAGETGAGEGYRALRIPNGLAFGAGFLVPWAAYGALAFAALVGTGRLADSSPGAAKWLGVAIFGAAGLYQLSPWKLRALRHCRMAMHSGEGGWLSSSLAAGIRDGAICVGCCWALMAILFAVGVMNLLAMAGLAAVIFAEKILPRPRLIAGLAGMAFLGLAVVAAAHPSILSGLTGSAMAMSVEGM
jgi:predicted metal-binding membrane protein